MRRAGFLLLTVAGLAGAAACENSNHAGAPVRIDPVALYVQNCARCHGEDGKGMPGLREAMPNMRDLSDPRWQSSVKTEQIEMVIMQGRNQMPPFGGALTMPKIQAVAGHVRKLGRTP